MVVLSAPARVFSAGADLNWMERMAGFSYEENSRDAMALAHLLRTLAALPKPTIARVHGPAYGGGVGLVACCDVAVAAVEATFALSEAKLGLIPATISPYVVEAIGARAARRYFLTAERFDAAEAYRIGLVHDIVPSLEALDERVNELLGAPDARRAAGAVGGQGARAGGGAPPDRRAGRSPTPRSASRRFARPTRRARASPRSSTRRSPAWVPEGLRKKRK